MLSEIQAPLLGQGTTSLLSMVEAKGPPTPESHTTMWVPLMDEKAVFHISYVCEHLCFHALSTHLCYCAHTIFCTSQHCSILQALLFCALSHDHLHISCTQFAHSCTQRIHHYVLSMTSQSHDSQLASLSVCLSVCPDTHTYHNSRMWYSGCWNSGRTSDNGHRYMGTCPIILFD